MTFYCVIPFELNLSGAPLTTFEGRRQRPRKKASGRFKVRDACESADFCMCKNPALRYNNVISSCNSQRFSFNLLLAIVNFVMLKLYNFHNFARKQLNFNSFLTSYTRFTSNI